MPLEELRSAKYKAVGTKQALKAVEKDRAVKVFIAEDAEGRVLEPLIEVCARKGVPVAKVQSMKELGKACGVEVNTASCALLIEESP